MPKNLSFSFFRFYQLGKPFLCPKDPLSHIPHSELKLGHDFLPEALPEPVAEILTRPNIFEHF